jgi:mono/diheme cytochrome c family protein
MSDPANGGTLYNGACAFCHGPEGEGGPGGGLPLVNATDLDVVMQHVRNGLNAMPPFGAALTPEQIQDVSAYVVAELPH